MKYARNCLIFKTQIWQNHIILGDIDGYLPVVSPTPVLVLIY